jgi:RimJ/RimL family protein N-acetyltransferase
MQPIKTTRLIIRNFSTEDWSSLHEIIRRYQESEYAQYDHPWPSNPEDIRNAVEWFSCGDSYLAVCQKSTDQLIGLLAIDRQDEGGIVHNLGFIFHPDYQGQGLAYESCQRVIRYLFEDLVADRILTGTHHRNEPSVNLLKRLGFQEITPGEYDLTRENWAAGSIK